ncbi:hypothetical protein PEBR_19184 [Penicillium brasilianum]|uniref:F-box domain-containing protein n=1 Tax=Penicillium brasilianum TaxID=104259 RepID=A0A0F7VC31_PENBI|nr:hypothetical protein PEBR_19184 [Penicillium brasilianum]CEO59494.1 hypothetical protein PMG11_04169 [Penicillium brasilianum]
MNGARIRLDLLHSDILSRIVRFLQPGDIEELSCVSKRLRNASIPVLFRAVRFEFSRSSLNGLKRLSGSDIRHHVVSLTYVAPEILKPEILDSECFSSELLTPDDYSDWIYEGRGFLPDDCPPYLLVHDVLRDICEEQQQIMTDHLDKTALFSIFTRLPRLKTMSLSFCPTIEEEEWIGSVLARGLTKEESCEYHSRAIRNAIEVARDSTTTESTVRVLITDQPA